MWNMKAMSGKSTVYNIYTHSKTKDCQVYETKEIVKMRTRIVETEDC
jgi:hypothetical protein